MLNFLDEKLQSLLSWSSAKGIQLKKAEVVEVPGFKYGIRATHKIHVQFSNIKH